MKQHIMRSVAAHLVAIVNKAIKKQRIFFFREGQIAFGAKDTTLESRQRIVSAVSSSGEEVEG